MINIFPVPAFKDNYIWILHRQETPYVAIVDPGDAQPVLDMLDRTGYQPLAILITHHHRDHTGGIKQLLERYPMPVYGPPNEGIADLSNVVVEGDQVSLQKLGCELDVIEVPGHTRGHVAYYMNGALFCGDTLFTGGCGRLFEGTPEQMYQSLKKIAALPASTQVYCAHEYTQDNLIFAKVVEPDNPDLQTRIEDTQRLRLINQPTVPAPLSLEMATNPFLRCDLPNVTEAAEKFALKSLNSGVDTFSTVRYWKDTLD
jgi:hydroxyacylglutathione hydrolase